MKTISLSINKAGWPFIGIFAAVTWALSYAGVWPLVIGLVLTLWCVYFFRDPARVTPSGVGIIVSPADGRVVSVQEVVPEADLGLGTEPRVRISIFLSIFNVHINRVPADGSIIATRYRAGKFVNASLDKASVDNERMAVVMELGQGHRVSGQKLGFVQIAGLIARRIICELEQGQEVHAGQRYGLIRFGSRADIYLPAGLAALVIVGQTMVGGETILADARFEEKQREGVSR